MLQKSSYANTSTAVWQSSLQEAGLYPTRALSEKGSKQQVSGWQIYKLQSLDMNEWSDFTPVKNMTSSLSHVFLSPQSWALQADWSNRSR